MNIILSIKPKWAELIYSGKKTIEWRKSWPKYEKFEFQHVGKVFLYETAPVKMITGYFELNGCRELIIREKSFEDRYKDIHPDAKEIIAAGCVPFEDLKKYQGKNFSLFGWRIKNPSKFYKPWGIQYAGIKRPPQSWCYVNDEIVANLLTRTAFCRSRSLYERQQKKQEKTFNFQMR